MCRLIGNQKEMKGAIRSCLLNWYVCTKLLRGGRVGFVPTWIETFLQSLNDPSWEAEFRDICRI